MTELVVLAASGGLLVSSVAVWRGGNAARFEATLEGYDLRFPLGIKPDDVTAFVAALSGVALPRRERWHSASGVVFEVTANQSGVGHRLLVPHDQAGIALSALRSQLPAVRTAPLPAVSPLTRPTVAAQLALSDNEGLLALGAPTAVTSGVLSSLQPLPDGVEVTLQWMVEPAGPTPAVDAASTSDLLLRWLKPAPAETGPSKTRRAKTAWPLFTVTPRVGVSARTLPEARAVLRRVLASFHASNAPGVHLYRRGLPSAVVARSMSHRRLPVVVPGALLNAAELAMLIGIPTGPVPAVGVALGTSRLLAPSPAIARHGRVLATSNFPGAERPLALSVEDSLRHLHIIGPTGVGKSTLLVRLITQDMQAGRGVIVIDPKGDLARDVLDRVPVHRLDDVVVLDPSDEERPVGLNLLDASAQNRELVVDQIVGTLHNLFAAFWGPRTDDILRSALLVLVEHPGMTLCEVPLLLTDQAFRRQLVGQLDEPVALEPFFAWFESLSDAERAQAIAPVLNKLRAFLLRRRLRLILGQATGGINLGEVLRENRILVVSLAKGVVGEEGAALLGSLLVARLWQAVTARAADDSSSRRPVCCYLDEFQDLLHLPTKLGDVLAQARGLGFGLTLAHQHLGQLPTALREDVLANARSRVIFQSAATDAKRLSREVTPYLSAADLQNLGAYEVALSLSAGGQVVPPATGRTEAAPPARGTLDQVRARSRERYGRDAAEVEAAIRARRTPKPHPGGIGRREVS